MNPDFSIYVRQHCQGKTQIRVYPSGATQIIEGPDGPEIHGHVGVKPYRYAISVLIEKPFDEVRREVISVCSMGILALDVELTKKKRVTGNGGERYTLYNGSIVNNG